MHTSVHVCVYMYLSVYVCMHAYMYVYVYIYVYVRMYVCTHPSARMDAYVSLGACYVGRLWKQSIFKLALVFAMRIKITIFLTPLNVCVVRNSGFWFP